MIALARALLAASAIVIVNGAAVVDVYHRVFHPDLEELQFAPKGQILSLDSSPSFASSTQTQDDFNTFAQALGEYSSDERALYQVALELGGSWEYSSIKYCHLGPAVSEDIILHASLSEPFTPHALDYFVTPIPHSGACSSDSAKTSFTNTTVTIHRPHFPPLPELRGQPPVVTYTPGSGEPVPPPEEKSFLQKYWVYIVAISIALMLSGGAPEEGSGGGPKRATA